MGRVVVIDSDEDYCARLSPLIAAHGLGVSTHHDAIGYLNSQAFKEPHVAVITLGQNAFNGLDLLRLAIERSGATHVFAVLETIDLPGVVTAVQMGATDVMQKPHSVDAIVRCALGVGAQQLAGLPPTLSAKGDKLSSREQEVLKLLLQGKNSAEIAKALSISIRTIESHQAKIYAKLGVKSRAALIHRFKS